MPHRQFIISGYLDYVYFEPIPVCRKSNQVNSDQNRMEYTESLRQKHLSPIRTGAVRTGEGDGYSSDATKQGCHL